MKMGNSRYLADSVDDGSSAVIIGVFVAIADLKTAAELDQTNHPQDKQNTDDGSSATTFLRTADLPKFLQFGSVPPSYKGGTAELRAAEVSPPGTFRSDLQEGSRRKPR